MGAVSITIEDQTFDPSSKLPRLWSQQHLKFCVLKSLEIYASIEGSFFGTTFDNVSFYLTLWNGSTVVDSLFNNCKFQGATFANSNIIHTCFSNCEFYLDNLGGKCIFDDSIFAQCKFTNCTFVDKKGIEQATFEHTNFHDCDFIDCLGMEKHAN